MQISKADAIAHLAKWYDARTEIRSTYSAVTGNLSIVGNITELTEAVIRITGKNCDMLLYFRSTSEYGYEDTREPPTEANRERKNRYPTIIDIKFANGDQVKILEFFKD
jgi:hypothetical protein